MTKPAYRRILLKLSGEMLAGDRGFGIDPTAVSNLLDGIEEVCQLGVELAVVVGGGNIFRGIRSDTQGIERTTGDYMGMLATMINALALQDLVEQRGIATRVLSAIEMSEIAEPYIRRRAQRHLEKRRLVIFACGTGNPYFSTDTAAALRAMEIGAQIVMKGTKVDYIYDHDPQKVSDAKPYRRITFREVLQQEIGVMDAPAFSLCMENKLPILVFNVGIKGNLRRAICGDDVGTLVTTGS